MAKIMRTIADIRSDVRRETTSAQPMLTDDYLYGNQDSIREKISKRSSPDALSDTPLETEEEENDDII